jgi:hypothetical protein
MLIFSGCLDSVVVFPAGSAYFRPMLQAIPSEFSYLCSSKGRIAHESNAEDRNRCAR